jgi:hypothetical protein
MMESFSGMSFGTISLRNGTMKGKDKEHKTE